MSTRLSFVALLVALTAFMGAVCAAEPEDRRHPVPDDADQKKAESAIRDIFKAEYANRDPKARAAFAKKLLQTGLETRNDLPARYGLFCEAATIAAGDLPPTTIAPRSSDLKSLPLDVRQGATSNRAVAVSVPDSGEPLPAVFPDRTPPR